MKLINVSEAADLTGRDRTTVRKAAQGLKVAGTGRNNSKLFRSDELLQRLYVTGDGPTYAEALRQLAVDRGQLTRVQTKTGEVTLKEKQRQLISVDDSIRYWETFAVHVKGVLDDFPEPYRTLTHFKLQECAILAAESMGVDAAKERAELAESRRKFEQEVKAGRIPRRWSDTFRPENDCRVWSQELDRYYTKAEIIAKFGPGVKISPIDEILDEAADSVDMEQR